MDWHDDVDAWRNGTVTGVRTIGNLQEAVFRALVIVAFAWVVGLMDECPMSFDWYSIRL